MSALLRIVVLAACAVACSAETDGSSEDALTGAYTNPVIPMYDRPAGVAHDVPKNVPHEATEGCPDPQGLKTKGGDFYIYCTSYTFRYSRLNGFPVFKSVSRTLSGPWAPVGSIIPDKNNSRQAWPKWVRDANGHSDGDFWGPDVHELPNGKFVAEYSAPCGATRCVGIAWANGPDGPWTHASTPFVSASNDTDVNPGGDAYDPTLLLATNGDNYLYWTVPGRGVYGVRVDYDSSGKLHRHVNANVFRIADRTKGQRGEGPYVIEHDGGFYEFYSTGSLLYGYFVGVRRGDAPNQPFDQEGPVVVHRNSHFVATGGNSIIQNAVHGKDVMVYHAIVAPKNGCPREDPVYGGAVKSIPANDDGANPFCRVQGDRQAMIDAIVWKTGAGGHEWPELANGTGTPSIGKAHLP